MHTPTKWRSPKSLFQGLSHCQVHPVSQGRLDQLVLHAEVLKPVRELGVGHVDRQLLQNVLFLGVKVKPHLRQPLEALWTCDFTGQQHSGHVTLMHKLRYLEVDRGAHTIIQFA